VLQTYYLVLTHIRMCTSQDLHNWSIKSFIYIYVHVYGNCIIIAFLIYVHIWFPNSQWCNVTYVHILHLLYACFRIICLFYTYCINNIKTVFTQCRHHFTVMYTFVIFFIINYSYVTSRSRISLLLHNTGCRVLITMISYECLWYIWLIYHCLWSQTDLKVFYLTLRLFWLKLFFFKLSTLLDFSMAWTLKTYLMKLFSLSYNWCYVDYTCLGLSNIYNVSQGNICTLNVS